jgi:ATP-dependent Clp protease ATP-binding subunit ClpB
VDFKNTVVIMTSNIGSHFVNDPKLADEERRVRALDALRQAFPPEFLNRIDDIIVFHSLSREDLAQIIQVQLKRLRKILAAQGLNLELSDKAVVFLAEKGYDPTYGARPLKRAIQQYVQDPLALALLQGQFKRGDTIYADVENGQVVFFKQLVGEVVA